MMDINNVDLVELECAAVYLKEAIRLVREGKPAQDYLRRAIYNLDQCIERFVDRDYRNPKKP